MTTDLFARPWLLLLALLPIAACLTTRHFRPTPRVPFAAPAALVALTLGVRLQRWRGVVEVLAWSLLAIGAAGPRWGEGEPDGVARGRDCVVLIDLSGSMLAADTDGPTRWQTAVRAATSLADWLRHAPGNRVAVVAFAARPVVVVPLTTDAVHLETALAELDATSPPLDTRPESGDASGTRIGRAIAEAVKRLDAGHAGSQDIILLSDGDDPARDREWVTGVNSARAAGIPVSVVGIGGEDATPIERNGTRFYTRLHDDVLREIAADGRGEYLAGGRVTPDLAALATRLAEHGETRELTVNPTAMRRDRAWWFMLAGAACLMVPGVCRNPFVEPGA